MTDETNAAPLTLEEVKKQYIAPIADVIALMDFYGVVVKLSGVTMKGIKAETGEPKSIVFPSIDTSEGFDLEAIFDAVVEELIAKSDKGRDEALKELLSIGRKKAPSKLPKSKDEAIMTLLGEVPKIKKVALTFKIGHFSIGTYGKGGYQAAFGFDNLDLDLNGLLAIGMKAVPLLLAVDA